MNEYNNKLIVTGNAADLILFDKEFDKIQDGFPDEYPVIIISCTDMRREWDFITDFYFSCSDISDLFPELYFKLFCCNKGHNCTIAVRSADCNEFKAIWYGHNPTCPFRLQGDGFSVYN